MAEPDEIEIEARDERGRRITRMIPGAPPATDHTPIPTAELEQLRADAARLRAFRTFLDTKFRFWCSPNGIAARYANDLLEILDRTADTTGGA